MKKVFFALIASCFLSTNIFAQASATPAEQKEENPNGAVITFEKLIHDFGTIPLKGNAEFEFKFTNTGNEPLIIQNCASSCTCTVPVCPREKPVRPGEQGSITVKYTTTNVPGAFNRQFTVTTNAKNSPSRLTLRGEIDTVEAVETSAN